MPIKDYSITAGSNTSVAGINIAEGCPAANVNNGMRAMMADTRSFYEGATWTDLGHTPTRTGATTFTINSDVTAFYIAGRRIRCTDSSTLYGTIDSSSYSAPNTTVTVTLDSGSLSASLTAVAVSVIDPTGDPIGVAAITGLPSTDLPDNTFRVVGSSDATKKVALEVDGLTTGTTRTLTVQDKNGTLPVIESGTISVPATSSEGSSITLAEDTDNGSNTVKLKAADTLGGNVTLTLPTSDGPVSIFRNMQVFTGSGTFTPGSGVTSVFVRVWGAGAGGGGVGAANTLGAGGGGAGGYSEGFVTVTPGVGVTVTVGAAGTGGAAGANNGTGGGNSSFAGGSTLTANGGSGGTGTASFGSAAGGAGGTASGGTLNITGGAGQAGAGASGTGIWGGAGGLPAGGVGIPGKFRPTNTEGQGAGFAAVGYGAGGGGANSSGSSQAGGDGAGGLVIVYYP
jgi:hypothetical protein